MTKGLGREHISHNKIIMMNEWRTYTNFGPSLSNKNHLPQQPRHSNNRFYNNNKMPRHGMMSKGLGSEHSSHNKIIRTDELWTYTNFGLSRSYKTTSPNSQGPVSAYLRTVALFEMLCLFRANRMVRLASMFVLRVQKGSDDVSYIKICVLKSRFRIYRDAGTNLKFSKKHFSTQKASTNQS